MRFAGNALQELGKSAARSGLTSRAGMVNKKPERMGAAVRGPGEIHEHPGWLIPFAGIAAILFLSGALYLYYMRPLTLTRNGTAPFRNSHANAAFVSLIMGELSLKIPVQYVDAGGGWAPARNRIALVAALPAMRSLSQKDALLPGNAPDSPLVHILIHSDRNPMDAKGRLARIYMPYVAEPKGEAGPFGLTHYLFLAGSGYGSEDLYSGNGGEIVFLCEHPAQDLPSPDCLAIDRPIAPGASLSFRFKRAELSSWRAIDTGVDRLIAGFRQ